MSFSGSIPALITPFRDDVVDENAFSALIDWQIDSGTNALVPNGTTGEAPTMSQSEQENVIRLCVEAAAKRVPVIAGAGSASTQHAVKMAQFAEKAGADAVMVVCPYYNRPNQDGLFLHFSTVAAATGLPVILYNVPTRTACDLLPDTVGRLAEIPNIVGLKDATGDLSRVARHRALCGDDFVLLSGDDSSALGFIAHGGDGVISVAANVVPDQMAGLMAAALDGDFATARLINDRVAELCRVLFTEPSPAPTKWALSRLGKSAPDCRLPVPPLSEAGQAIVRAAALKCGLEL